MSVDWNGHAVASVTPLTVRNYHEIHTIHVSMESPHIMHIGNSKQKEVIQRILQGEEILH